VTTLPGEKSLRSTIGVGEIAHDPKGLAGLVHRAHAVRSSKYALVGVDAAKDDVGPVGRQRHHLLERVTPVGAVKAVTNDRIPSLNYDQWGLAGRLLALVHFQVAIERNNLVEVVRITEIVLTIDVLLVAGFSFLAKENQREGCGFEEMKC